MSQQGGRPTGHEDDWWGQLYDDSTGDTGPTPAPDSLDDRFASAAGTVGGPGETGSAGAEPMVPAPRSGADDVPGAPRPTGGAPQRAPWEPPLARATGPVTFPTASHPRGRSEPGPGRPPRPPAPPTAPARGGTAPPDPRDTRAASIPASWPPRGPEPAPAGPDVPAGDPGRRPEAPAEGSRGSTAPAPPPAPPAPPPASPPPPPPSAPPGRSAPQPPPAPPADPPRDATPPAATGRPAPPAPVDPPPVRPGTAGPPSAAPGPAGPPPGSPSAAGTPPASAGAAVPPAVAPGDFGPPSVPPVAGSPSTAPAAGSLPAPPVAFVAEADESGPLVAPPASVPRARVHVGSRPPTYDAEPTALPSADPDDLGDLVPDTVLDGARYGACTLRAASVRGDSARYRGEPRRDALLTARFGTGEHALVLVAMATGARTAPGAHRAAAEACHWIGRAVGRSHARLVEDIRGGRRGDLKSGLHRLTDRSLGKLRASASEQGVAPEEYAAGLRCLLLPADPDCRTRVFFGVGPGGLFRLREGEWQDIEPQVADVRGEAVLGYGSPPPETPEGDRLTMDLGIPTPPSPYEPAPEPPREPFRFRTSVARPGDTLLMCSGGLAEPLRGEPELGEYLAERWSRPEPPGLAAFLADSQVRVKGYADDRTAAAVWEA
ncbi:protein phosphatase 2C domain-containing protein [Streptomyces sp. NPDC029554]|uniref:protein phosphatase 2C domain-containing protein n=1 Tax=Streptomyces sp. NPDC029554 TaxID=3155126 RepID=UPI0033E21300